MSSTLIVEEEQEWCEGYCKRNMSSESQKMHRKIEL